MEAKTTGEAWVLMENAIRSYKGKREWDFSDGDDTWDAPCRLMPYPHALRANSSPVME